MKKLIMTDNTNVHKAKEVIQYIVRENITILFTGVAMLSPSPGWNVIFNNKIKIINNWKLKV